MNIKRYGYTQNNSWNRKTEKPVYTDDAGKFAYETREEKRGFGSYIGTLLISPHLFIMAPNLNSIWNAKYVDGIFYPFDVFYFILHINKNNKNSFQTLTHTTTMSVDSLNILATQQYVSCRTYFIYFGPDGNFQHT